MGLNKPITVSGGLTAAEVQTTVQSIIDAQTTAITGKVDEQTNTLKTDLPSSISGGASISDINAALDEKLPQYQNGAVVKSKQVGVFGGNADGSQKTIAISPVNSSKSTIKFFTDIGLCDKYSSTIRECNPRLISLDDDCFTIIQANGAIGSGSYGITCTYEIIEFY